MRRGFNHNKEGHIANTDYFPGLGQRRGKNPIPNSCHPAGGRDPGFFKSPDWRIPPKLFHAGIDKTSEASHITTGIIEPLGVVVYPDPGFHTPTSPSDGFRFKRAYGFVK
ncbi:hypothetical protein [Faecalibaculum rodentium]|uniref:hypothetical protein n=1 Tax=Faecalibaculum rodentium TaxID=1702221 RepID=UPI003F6723AD